VERGRGQSVCVCVWWGGGHKQMERERARVKHRGEVKDGERERGWEQRGRLQEVQRGG